jgi:hypothetical protein
VSAAFFSTITSFLFSLTLSFDIAGGATWAVESGKVVGRIAVLVP